MTIDLQPYTFNVSLTSRFWATEHVFEAGHQVDLSKATVTNRHPHLQTHCLLESWHIQHPQAPLNREQGSLSGLCIQPCLTDSFSPFTPPTPLYLTHFHIFIPAVLPVFIYASRNYPYLYTLHLKVSLSLMKTAVVFLKHLINPSSTWLAFLTKLLWLYQASQASTAKFMHLALFIHHFQHRTLFTLVHTLQIIDNQCMTTLRNADKGHRLADYINMQKRWAIEHEQLVYAKFCLAHFLVYALWWWFLSVYAKQNFGHVYAYVLWLCMHDCCYSHIYETVSEPWTLS